MQLLPRRWRARAVLVLLSLVAGMLLAGPRPAAAHAVLLRSSPTANARLAVAPQRVQLFFSEPLSRALSSVEVRNGAGSVTAGRTATFTHDPTEMDLALPVLQPGFYAVAWTTVSAVDGHRLQGEVPFTVLNADGSIPAGVAPRPRATGSAGVNPFDALLRWLLLLGLIAATGAFAVGLLVVRPALGGLAGSRAAVAGTSAERLAARWAPWAAAAIALATAVTLGREVAQAGGFARLSAVLSSRTGSAAIARVVIAAGLVGVAVALRRGAARGHAMWLLGAGLLVGLLGLLTMSLTSHAAARAGAGWGVPADFLHLASVALWLGALLYLPALLRLRGVAREDRAARLRLDALLLQRFSALAVISVGALVLTGLFSASIETGSLHNLGDTAYGQTLIVKSAAVALTFAAGLLNALVLAPRLARAAEQGEERPAAHAAVVVRRSVLAEAMLGVGVVAVTAVLVLLVPARDAAAQRRAGQQPAAIDSVYRNSAPATDLQVALVVSPNRPGLNDFRVALTGPAVDQVTRVELRFQPPDQSQGLSVIDLQPAGTGVYAAQATNLLAAGDWGVTVNIRRTGHDDANGRFVVQVPDVTGATVQSPTQGSTLWTYPGRGITENQTLGVALAFLGFVLYRLRPSLRRRGRAPGRAATGLMLASFLVAGTLFFATHSHGGAGEAAPLNNPVPADARSVGDGQALYAQNCAQCHGVAGHGDGPLAANLHPRPYDLTVHVGLHPDYQLFDYITHGIPSTAMPARGQLSDQQRWDLVNYLRTLSPEGRALPAAEPNTPKLAARPKR